MRRISFLIVLSFILTSCAVPTPTAAPLPSATSIPPTAALTATPNIPTIDVDGVQIPDPKVTNPELFDLKNPDSPIVQFANAFGVKPEDVLAGVHAEMETPANGNPSFPVLRTSDGFALFLGKQGKNGKWTWEKATPGEYWYAQGKQMGLYLTWDEFRSSEQLVKDYFSGGIMVTETQMLPANVPSRTALDADPLAVEAQANHMSLFYSYVAEPGKFPAEVNTTNVDTWLDTRFEGIIQEVKSHQTEGHPAYISFNEAWGELSGWNPEFNPLREKYGENWVGKYISKFLSKFIDNGLVPNKDFVIVFNDARLYNRPKKQDLVFNTLLQARQDAFDSLISDSAMKEKLSQMGINNVGDIQILLGAETHTKLGSNQDDVLFWPAPTDEQLTQLSEEFAPLGGIIMTEVNPFGTPQQKEAFLKEKAGLLAKLPNLRGIIFWNVVKDSDDGSQQYPLSGDRLILFDENGSPTSLYYALLSNK